MTVAQALTTSSYADVHAPVRYAELILSALNAQPERSAFHWTQDGRDLTSTYGQTARQILRLSNVITGLELGDTGGLALLTGPRPEAFTLMAAACHAGVRYAALHPMATRHNDTYVLRDSATAVLVVDDTNTLFDERARSATESTRILALTDLLALAGDASQSIESAADATYLFYTGGTTGEPKGVVLRDRSLTANAWAGATWPWPDETRLLLTTPMSHAAGLLVAPGLLRGAAFHIHDYFDPARVVHAIEHEGVNATFVVPTMLYALLDHLDAQGAGVRGLEWLLYGAAPTTPARIIEARRRFGPVLTQHYGQAEAPNALTMLDRHSHLSENHDVLTSCGRPMPGVRIELLDSTGDRVAPGTPGELCVRGPLIMDGYWNKPDQTAAALAGGWLHTGDIAVRDDMGNLRIVDRLKDMIITGGFNVYPREVEDVLGAHPAVASSGVYGEPDDRWGESVVAAVVLRPGRMVSAEKLIAYVREQKGGVWAPKRVDFRDHLPLTALGKVDKKRLRESG